MAKVAILASFEITKRMVIEVPDGMTLDQYLDTDDGFCKVFYAAADQFKSDIGNYLLPDNFNAVEDTEIPATENETPSV